MSRHSYSRCWIHLVWGTLHRDHVFQRVARKRVSGYLANYSMSKQIYMKTNFVNEDHVHALIDLPTGRTLEETIQLLKGSSSHWINKHGLVPGRFSWGRGYGAFSVSHSRLKTAVDYIADQEEHHRVRSYQEEYAEFFRRYGNSPGDHGNR